jgi:hypothetical protein
MRVRQSENPTDADCRTGANEGAPVRKTNCRRLTHCASATVRSPPVGGTTVAGVRTGALRTGANGVGINEQLEITMTPREQAATTVRDAALAISASRSDSSISVSASSSTPLSRDVPATRSMSGMALARAALRLMSCFDWPVFSAVSCAKALFSPGAPPPVGQLVPLLRASKSSFLLAICPASSAGDNSARIQERA